MRTLGKTTQSRRGFSARRTQSQGLRQSVNFNDNWTRSAADNVNIVKLLPPLIIGDEEIDAFVAALDDVLADATRNAGLLLEVGTTMARNTMRRNRRHPKRGSQPGPRPNSHHRPDRQRNVPPDRAVS